LLAVPDRKTGRILPTAIYSWLDKRVAEISPELIVFDALYDIYGGDENVKGQVRQFVSLIRKLTAKHKCSVVVTGHPSLFGMSSGTGTSGSVAWNNAFRSRLYITKDAKSRPGGVAVHKVAVKKSNYGAGDVEIETCWQDGVFVPIEDTGASAEVVLAQSKEIFLRLLKDYTAENRRVNAKSGPNYAPTVFDGDHRAEGCTKGDFKRAMNTLLSEGAIRNENYTDGNRNKTTCLVVAGKRA